jgi:hypothetical protein
VAAPPQVINIAGQLSVNVSTPESDDFGSLNLFFSNFNDKGSAWKGLPESL